MAQGPTKGVHALVLSLDGKLLITATGNAFTIWQWDGKGQLKELHTAQAQESAFVYGMALSPDDKTLAITWDAKVHLYDVASGQLRITLEKSHVGCWGPLVYSPDGTTVAASIIMQEEEGDWVVQRRTFLRTWDTATGKARNTSMTTTIRPADSFAVRPVVPKKTSTRTRPARGEVGSRAPGTSYRCRPR